MPGKVLERAGRLKLELRCMVLPVKPLELRCTLPPLWQRRFSTGVQTREPTGRHTERQGLISSEKDRERHWRLLGGAAAGLLLVSLRLRSRMRLVTALAVPDSRALAGLSLQGSGRASHRDSRLALAVSFRKGHFRLSSAQLSHSIIPQEKRVVPLLIFFGLCSSEFEALCDTSSAPFFFSSFLVRMITMVTHLFVPIDSSAGKGQQEPFLPAVASRFKASAVEKFSKVAFHWLNTGRLYWDAFQTSSNQGARIFFSILSIKGLGCCKHQ